MTQKIKILISMSDVKYVEKLIRLFPKEHYEVMGVIEGKAAVNIIKKEKDIKLIITSLNLSDINGYSILNFLTKNREGIKKIVATHENSDKKKEAAFKYGADDLFSLPNDFNKLIDFVNDFKSSYSTEEISVKKPENNLKEKDLIISENLNKNDRKKSESFDEEDINKEEVDTYEKKKESNSLITNVNNANNNAEVQKAKKRVVVVRKKPQKKEVTPIKEEREAVYQEVKPPNSLEIEKQSVVEPIKEKQYLDTNHFDEELVTLEEVNKKHQINEIKMFDKNKDETKEREQEINTNFVMDFGDDNLDETAENSTLFQFEPPKEQNVVPSFEVGKFKPNTNQKFEITKNISKGTNISEEKNVLTNEERLNEVLQDEPVTLDSFNIAEHSYEAKRRSTTNKVVNNNEDLNYQYEKSRQHDFENLPLPKKRNQNTNTELAVVDPYKPLQRPREMQEIDNLRDKINAKTQKYGEPDQYYLQTTDDDETHKKKGLMGVFKDWVFNKFKK